MLPNVEDSDVVLGQDERLAQIAQAQRTKVHLKHCHTVGTESSGATTDHQGLPDLVGVQKHRAVVKFMSVSELASDDSSCQVVSVGSGPGELLQEFCCNSPFV